MVGIYIYIEAVDFVQYQASQFGRKSIFRLVLHDFHFVHFSDAPGGLLTSTRGNLPMLIDQIRHFWVLFSTTSQG